MARCTKIYDADTDEPKYIINVKQLAKFVVGLGDRVAPTDIEEGMRVGIDRSKLSIQIPLPPKIDAMVYCFVLFGVSYSNVLNCLGNDDDCGRET